MKLELLFGFLVLAVAFGLPSSQDAPIQEPVTISEEIAPPLVGQGEPMLTNVGEENPGLLPGSDSLADAVSRMRNTLPPGLRGMIDKQISGMGGIGNLQKALDERVAQFGGMGKLREAMKSQLSNMGFNGLMRGPSGIEGNSPPALPTGPIGVVPRRGDMHMGVPVPPVENVPVPTVENASPLSKTQIPPPVIPVEAVTKSGEINVPTKDEVKSALEDAKQNLPVPLQQLIGQQAGGLDLSRFGIEKFPATREEAQKALKKIEENLPEGTRNMLAQMRSRMTSGKGGNQGLMQGMLGNKANLIKSLIGGKQSGMGGMLAKMMAGGSNPIAAMLGKNMNPKMMLITQMMQAQRQRQVQEHAVAVHRAAAQRNAMAQQQAMMAQQMRDQMALLKRREEERQSAQEQRPITINININPENVMDIHDISAEAIYALKSLYRQRSRGMSRMHPMGGQMRQHNLMTNREDMMMMKRLDSQIMNEVKGILSEI